MTHDMEPEVDFILTAIEDAVGYGNGYGIGYGWSDLSDIPLQRVDRDNARNIDTGNRVKSESHSVSNYVSARTATSERSAIGTEYDHELQSVVNIRITGAPSIEGGHIDPEGANGVIWRHLKRSIRRAILEEREFPSVPNQPNTTYTWVDERNISDLSGNFADEYRWEADYAFIGYESLP